MLIKEIADLRSKLAGISARRAELREARKNLAERAARGIPEAKAEVSQIDEWDLALAGEATTYGDALAAKTQRLLEEKGKANLSPQQAERFIDRLIDEDRKAVEEKARRAADRHRVAGDKAVKVAKEIMSHLYAVAEKIPEWQEHVAEASRCDGANRAAINKLRAGVLLLHALRTAGLHHVIDLPWAALSGDIPLDEVTAKVVFSRAAAKEQATVPPVEPLSSAGPRLAAEALRKGKPANDTEAA